MEALMRQRRWLKWTLFVTGWSLVGLLFALQEWFTYPAEKPPVTWARQLSSEMAFWYAWAALFPVVWWLARRYPLESARLGRRLLLHLPAAALFAVVHPFLQVFIVWLLRVFSEPLMVIAARRIPHSLFWDVQLGIALYWLMLIACHAIQYQARLRAGELKASQLEAQLAQAQLSALKMQLHPHFLFNTLHSISALLHSDVEAADRMVARLGDFLRLTLDNSDNQEVTLEQELEFLRCYLEIELTRFQDRLTVDLEIAPSTLTAHVPNLILQPIVENAIRHGIAVKIEPGSIRISSERRGGRLRIQIRDDGPGFASNTENGNGYREGIGLTNARARLARLYGQDQVLELSNGREGGAVVTLEMPFHASEVVAHETAGTASG
jgi:two-component system, LytTR family, sensor kinase